MIELLTISTIIWTFLIIFALRIRNRSKQPKQSIQFILFKTCIGRRFLVKPIKHELRHVEFEYGHPIVFNPTKFVRFINIGGELK